MSKRNFVEEILEKKNRNHKRGSRIEIFRRRVHPLVEGFRTIRALDESASWRNEWLKYGAIGYIACVEGYFRILIADLINLGDPYTSRISNFKEIKFNAESVVAISKRKVSIGEFVAHLLPMNGVADINNHLSALINSDYIEFYNSQPLPRPDKKLVGEVFQKEIGNLENLFKLRHLHAHELATKHKFPVRDIENLVGSAALFVTLTEEIANREWFNKT